MCHQNNTLLICEHCVPSENCILCFISFLHSSIKNFKVKDVSQIAISNISENCQLTYMRDTLLYLDVKVIKYLFSVHQPFYFSEVWLRSSNNTNQKSTCFQQHFNDRLFKSFVFPILQIRLTQYVELSNKFSDNLL